MQGNTYVLFAFHNRKTQAYICTKMHQRTTRTTGINTGYRYKM